MTQPIAKLNDISPSTMPGSIADPPPPTPDALKDLRDAIVELTSRFGEIEKKVERLNLRCALIRR